MDYRFRLFRYFFEENKIHLQSGYFGKVSVEMAIERTRDYAIKLRKQFDKIIKNHEDDTKLQAIFRPLNDATYKIKELPKEKSKSGWLRIYAIRISENTYVITGGGIKLTKTMQECSYLSLELQKMELTRNFLIEQGLTDEADFGFFEIYP